MSTIKRCISLLLVLGILFGVLAPAAQAAPAEETATVDTDAMTIKGTNGFGNLLSREITESQEEAEAADAEYPGGYTVTDLVIEGSTATVTYDTMEEATLVVALYTEDGMQMLTSTTATVTPDAMEAELTFEGEMPEYFLASAYLLDSYDLSPLCAAYDTPMYTREMQELLASTVNDYDPEKVLNLDEDETTNFAVFADGVVIVEPAENANTVLSMDEENLIYVIGNASEVITSLEKDTIFVYPISEEDILIVKVSDITVADGTATIQGSELSLDEVFSHVKLESTADPENAEVEENSGTQGIQYLGRGQAAEAMSVNSDDGSDSALDFFNFSIFYESEKDAHGLSVRVKGDLALSIESDFSFHKAGWRSHVRLQVDTVVDFEISITGRKTFPEFNLKKIHLPFKLPCIKMYCEPKITLRVDAAIELNGRFTATTVATVSLDGHDFRFSNMDLEWKNVEFDGEVFFFFNLNPTISVEETVLFATLHIVKFTIYMPLGVRLKFLDATVDLPDADSPTEKHTCNVCFKIPVDFVSKFSFRIMFLNNPKLGLDIPLGKEKTTPLFHLYWSLDHGEFKKGDCPHYVYRLTAAVTGEEDAPVGNATITVGSEKTTTNSNGVATMYLPKGTYTVIATSGEQTKSKSIKIDEAEKVTIGLGEDADHILENADDILVAEIVDMDGVLRTPLATYEGHTYTLFDGAASTWDEAKAYCEALGGHLATIANADENTFLYEYMRESGYSNAYWGLTDREVEGVWEWCTGEPVTYLNWATEEPNNGRGGTEHYGMFYDGAGCPPGYWNDGNFGDDGYAFLCEWDFILTEITEQQDAANTIAPNALYPGDYGTEVTDTYTLKTASFKDLVPNEQYVLLAMASIELENPLASDNLLFIDQTAAAEDGTLTFRYVQRTPCDISYVVACGASHKNLNDAEISFPKMVADGELQVVDPVVVYDGVTLTEGRDYVIVGSVDFTEAGEYTCYIRGIHNYTGSVECIYTVGQAENPFVDVADDSFCIDAVLWAVEEGITKGITDTRFAPDDLTTRGQIVTFLWRAAGEPEPASNANPFTDVKEEDFCYKAVLWAVENGITKGMTETIFAPNSSCTRAQAVTFLHRSMGKPAYTITGSGFTDVTDPEEFCYDAILWAVENEITGGLGDGTFGVDQTCTRGQIVTFLYRTLA